MAQEIASHIKGCILIPTTDDRVLEEYLVSDSATRRSMEAIYGTNVLKKLVEIWERERENEIACEKYITENTVVPFLDKSLMHRRCVRTVRSPFKRVRDVIKWLVLVERNFAISVESITIFGWQLICRVLDNQNPYLHFNPQASSRCGGRLFWPEIQLEDDDPFQMDDLWL